jgi:electron transport complex protein RnfG
VAASLAGLESTTRERIIANQAEQVRRSLDELLPPASSFDNAPQLDVVGLKTAGALGSEEALPAWRARLDGQAVAAILTVVAPDGYVDRIRLLVGISVDGRLLGVRVAAHRETPGLGDAIETSRSAWIYGFDDRNLQDGTRWALGRDGGDFDAITGATITSRAVVDAVYSALDYFSRNQAMIFSAPTEAGSKPAIDPRPDNDDDGR